MDGRDPWNMEGAIPAILKILVCLVHLWTQEGRLEQGMELLSFVLHQSAILQDTKKHATDLSAELTSTLAPDVVAEAKEQGKARELDILVAEILAIRI